ncbi:hypothetical protein BJY01DRAFT_259391 [Aspergillus pseudoustus]|uniref:FAD-binding PCMH-type domain-containing protein n=1 Tax=Aspergillus pseudoustus TaxID=1810923 RepID=A0ABR4J432_9EURO
MATLNTLKATLRQAAREPLSPSSTGQQPLSDNEYNAGFEVLWQGTWTSTYEEFIIPQLAMILEPLFTSRNEISILEIGPGPKSVLGFLPCRLRRKIRRYTAFEPNALFAARLRALVHTTGEEAPLPDMDCEPRIEQRPFVINNTTSGETPQSYDIILFCHSMYGLKPRDSYIKHALTLLAAKGMVVVFHREDSLRLDGLVCHQTASFPTGTVHVPETDGALDAFTPFIAGFVLSDIEADQALRAEWREICRALAHRNHAYPQHLLFSAPDVMVIFTQHATSLPGLAFQVPITERERVVVKNRHARVQNPAAIAKPRDIRHVQLCVEWALEHRGTLSILGGGHGDHCLQSNVVAVDMHAFKKIRVYGDNTNVAGVVVVGAGCTAGDIVEATLPAGLIVPMGSRPSVGAGLWLQGGIGHLSRLYGLTCDAIVGAVMVSVNSGQILCIGSVPDGDRPPGSVRPENEDDLLWAMRGAGTNFGIVVSVVFKVFRNIDFVTHSWTVPLKDTNKAQEKISAFNEVATQVPRTSSADAYLYWDSGSLRMGVMAFAKGMSLSGNHPGPWSFYEMLGKNPTIKTPDTMGLFEADMYMSTMHGGHGGGKTSSFKRCLFLKDIGAQSVTSTLTKAMSDRPTPLCYFHLLHGAGALRDTAPSGTAFGVRDWDFACVITGVWPREEDGTETARGVVRWVYNTANAFLKLPACCGVYNADLGPDPRDVPLASRAFGSNRPRLARLKRTMDPWNVLTHACPLPKEPMESKLIILVTGETGAGKDYCAELWVSTFAALESGGKAVSVRAVSISDATKQEYANATGADLELLLGDRAYKEQHRGELTAFYQVQVRRRPRLPEEHFPQVVYANIDVDVIFITGMRDHAPVATLGHLVPDSRLLEVRVTAREDVRRARGARGNSNPGEEAGDHRPCFIFENNLKGTEAATQFAHHFLFPLLHEDLDRLADMVRAVPDFPRPGIQFRHVLDIAQKPNGLTLCTTLLGAYFCELWSGASAIVSIETGGLILASALAAHVNIPLALIREGGKLPPPTVSVRKATSHISSPPSGTTDAPEKIIEMERGLIPSGGSVVIVDDVFASGQTLYAVITLLDKAGIAHENINVLVVAEFPAHRGRELLRKRGVGRIRIRSLLVFGGA